MPKGAFGEESKHVNAKDGTSGFVYSLVESNISNWKGIVAFKLYLVGFTLHFPLRCGEEACECSPCLGSVPSLGPDAAPTGNQESTVTNLQPSVWPQFVGYGC